MKFNCYGDTDPTKIGLLAVPRTIHVQREQKERSPKYYPETLYLIQLPLLLMFLSVTGKLWSPNQQSLPRPT